MVVAAHFDGVHATVAFVVQVAALHFRLRLIAISQGLCGKISAPSLAFFFAGLSAIEEPRRRTSILSTCARLHGKVGSTGIFVHTLGARFLATLHHAIDVLCLPLFRIELNVCALPRRVGKRRQHFVAAVMDHVGWPAAKLIWNNNAAIFLVRNDVSAVAAVDVRPQLWVQRKIAVVHRLVLHAARIDIQRPSSVLQNIGRHGSHQRLTRNNYWFMCRFQRRAPACPLHGGICSRCGNWLRRIVVTDFARIAVLLLGLAAMVRRRSNDLPICTRRLVDCLAHIQ